MGAATLDPATESMVDGPTSQGEAVPRPGLALLYADDFRRIAPAFPFARERVVLGRSDEADVRIEVASISRRHALFERRASADGTRVWTVTDLGSHNGTFVDGRATTGAVELSPGAMVRAGDVLLQFVERAVDAYGDDHLDGTPLGPHAQLAPHPGGRWQVARAADALRRVARSRLSVAIFGETGTGKEVFAEFVHRESERKGPLRALNCAAFPASLIESELFGYKRGAFSGADRDKSGLVQSAHGGTLLLDEIGDMPLEAQAKLLRVLQTKEVLPLGAVSAEPVDVRVVSATHRDLRARIEDGRFRADLYARIAEVSVTLPPLRDRKEDLYLLVSTFLRRAGKPNLGVTFRFMHALLAHDYPFNVRELESIVNRAATFSEGERLDLRHLPDELRSAAQDGLRAKPSRAPFQRGATEPPAALGDEPDPPSNEPGERAEGARLRHGSAGGRGAVLGSKLRERPTPAELQVLLERHRGNVAAVARELARTRVQIHRWMQRYGLDPDAFRDRAR
ncbi:MAG: sigma 54-interacting transcriptional regulator [Polyangiaceae bacterium]